MKVTQQSLTSRFSQSAGATLKMVKGERTSMKRTQLCLETLPPTGPPSLLCEAESSETCVLESCVHTSPLPGSKV